jgi:plastocyanin domain-containing protein
MDVSEILVLIGGVLLVAGIGWYFFGEREAAEAKSAGAGGVQEVAVTVRGGYAPDTIRVRAGQPVRLKFYRDETNSCSEQVVLGDFGIVRDLPAHQTTAVEFTPTEPGEYAFTCGMNMLRGKLIVQPA